MNKNINSNDERTKEWTKYTYIIIKAIDIELVKFSNTAAFNDKL